jgi:hypothetical protein
MEIKQALLVLVLGVTLPSATQSPGPVPSATPCAIFTHMFAPTQAAFHENNLTSAEQTYIMKFVAKMPASDRQYAKWLRTGSSSEPGYGLIIFSATPLSYQGGGYWPWLAVNTNVFVDPHACEVNAYPGPMRTPS